MTRLSKNSGATLVEVIVAMTIFTLVLGMVGLATLSGQEAYKTGINRSHLENHARRTVDRIASEVLEAGTQWILPQPLPPLGNSTLNYRRNEGFAAGNIVWSTNRQIQFQYAPGELNDGVDNDGNGLIDDGVAVMIRDVGGANQQTITLSRWVPELLEGELPNGNDDNGNGLQDEQGLSFEYEPVEQRLTVRLTLQRPDVEGRIATSTVQTSVRIRN